MPTTIWREFVEAPFVNYLMALVALTGSFGAAIVLLSVSTRTLTLPLTVRSQRHAVRMRAIQPRLKALSQRHQDPARRVSAQRALYSEAGVNPLGMLGPSLVQFPIFIAVNHAVRVATAGDDGAAVSGWLYHVDLLRRALPLDTHFLFLDLGQPGTLWMGAVVFALMVAQQQTSGSSPSRSSRNLGLVMSAVFAAFVLKAPAGLGLYWISSLLFALAIQVVLISRKRAAWEADVVLVDEPDDPFAPDSEAVAERARPQRDAAWRKRRKQNRKRRR